MQRTPRVKRPTTRYSTENALATHSASPDAPPPAPALPDAPPPAKKARTTVSRSTAAEPPPAAAAAAAKRKPAPKATTKKAKAEQAATQRAAEALLAVQATPVISVESLPSNAIPPENATKTPHALSTPGASTSTLVDTALPSPLPTTLSSTIQNPKRPRSSLSNPKGKDPATPGRKTPAAKSTETAVVKPVQTTDVNLQDKEARLKLLYGTANASFKKKPAVPIPESVERVEIKVAPAAPVTPVYQSAEERQRAIVNSKLDQREQVRKGKLTAIDLLEDSRIMQLFEIELRSHVHALQAGAAKEDPNAPPLPRLLTYGSVFSLFPRGE